MILHLRAIVFDISYYGSGRGRRNHRRRIAADGWDEQDGEAKCAESNDDRKAETHEQPASWHCRGEPANTAWIFC